MMWCEECQKIMEHHPQCPNSSGLNVCARCEEIADDVLCKSCKADLESRIQMLAREMSQEEKDYVYDYITSEGF